MARSTARGNRTAMLVLLARVLVSQVRRSAPRSRESGDDGVCVLANDDAERLIWGARAVIAS